jgi:xanthine dehydrogenase small subunit
MEDLYLGYMKKAMAPDEILEAIEVPLPTPALRFRTAARRFDSDILVCAAFAIELEGDRIRRCRVALGGVAATPKRRLRKARCPAPYGARRRRGQR